MLKHVIAGAALALAVAAPAQAAIVFDLGAPTGATESPGSFTYNFTAGVGAGQIDFVIQGYNTLDGVNCCTVTLNGTQLLVGSYNLGGGGSDVTTVQAPGSSLTVNTPARTVTFSSAVALANGANSLTFAYSGGAQGTGDEAWGINSATVTGNAFVAVPEPAAWAMLVLGFGAIGGALRSARGSRATVRFA